MKNFILFLGLSIFSISTLFAKSITGKVTDDNGQPLSGVNISIQGTSTGTQTDFDGKYTIEAKTGNNTNCQSKKTKHYRCSNDGKYKFR